MSFWVSFGTWSHNFLVPSFQPKSVSSDLSKKKRWVFSLQVSFLTGPYSVTLEPFSKPSYLLLPETAEVKKSLALIRGEEGQSILPHSGLSLNFWQIIYTSCFEMTLLFPIVGGHQQPFQRVTFFSPSQNKENLLPSLKLTACPWKWMIGIRSFPFGARPIFRGKLAVSFREC